VEIQTILRPQHKVDQGVTVNHATAANPRVARVSADTGQPVERLAGQPVPGLLDGQPPDQDQGEGEDQVLATTRDFTDHRGGG